MKDIGVKRFIDRQIGNVLIIVLLKCRSCFPSLMVIVFATNLREWCNNYSNNTNTNIVTLYLS